MHQITFQIINQKVTSRGPNGKGSHFFKHQPLNSGYVLGGDRGKLGSDFGHEAFRVGPVNNHDLISVGESDGVHVQRAEKVRVVHQPAFLARAEVAEIRAGDGPHLRRVRAFWHFFGVVLIGLHRFPFTPYGWIGERVRAKLTTKKKVPKWLLCDFAIVFWKCICSFFFF